VLPAEAQTQISEIAKHSEHLHQLDIEKARHEAFRPISHAVVTLATIARGDFANQPFFHMFCPMVKGGAGDWLQANNKLINPYWGSKMLRCGEQAHEFPIGVQLEKPVEKPVEKANDQAEKRPATAPSKSPESSRD
jgi:hypothetical protein